MQKGTGIGKTSGWLALSPLIVFLLVYLVSSLCAGDFYKVPVASAFLIASVYAIMMTRGRMDSRIAIFSNGAGHPNVLMMLWIFILAGAFAGTAKEIGAIDATVSLTLMILPGKLLLSGLFLASCFVSMSVGTSVGTIVALVPIASGIASETGVSVAMMTAVIVGGAFFGDNLSFISDTTIAATRSQGCSMADKFKANIWLAAPAALITAGIYLFLGWGIQSVPDHGDLSIIRLIPYLSVMLMALSGVNVMVTLTAGLLQNALIGICGGSLGWLGFLSAVGSGIAGMGDLIIVTMLAGGMLGMIRHNGGIDFLISSLSSRIRGKRGAEFSIAAMVSLANFCTANNTIAIITTGDIARDISRRYALDPRKTASILDTFSCIVQGLIPYGAQMLMASGLAGVSAISITACLYYPFILLAIACASIIFRLPRRYS